MHPTINDQRLHDASRTTTGPQELRPPQQLAPGTASSSYRRNKTTPGPKRQAQRGRETLKRSAQKSGATGQGSGPEAIPSVRSQPPAPSTDKSQATADGRTRAAQATTDRVASSQQARHKAEEKQTKAQLRAAPPRSRPRRSGPGRGALPQPVSPRTCGPGSAQQNQPSGPKNASWPC